MKKTFFLFLVLVIIFSVFTTVGAEEKGELQITVKLGDKDVTLEAQVMLLKVMMPVILQPGQEKSVKVEAGTYQITALLPGEKGVSPAAGEVTVQAGRVKRITMNLKDMPDPSSGKLPDMSDMLTDDDEFIPEEATEAELREALEAEYEKVYKSAFNELYNRHKNAFLAEMLSHSRGEIRELSLNIFYMLTAEAKIGHPSEATPIEENRQEIIQCLQDHYLPARIKAIEIMANYPEFPVEVMPTLIEALEDPEVDVRYAAVRTFGLGLGRVGRDEKEVIKALVARVEKDKEARVRKEAIQSLGYFKVTDFRVYEALAGALSDEELEVRRKSAGVLSELGASASILNEITAALEYSDWQIKNNLLKAMQGLDRAELHGVIFPVAEMLEDEDRYVRIQAARVIRSAGPAGVQVLPALIKALSDERTEVIREVAWTLDALGPDPARKALPELLQFLTVETSSLGHDTVFAISSVMVTIGEPAISSLIELLSHNKFEARARSASILGRMGPAAEGAVPMLESKYQDENEHDAVRREAYYAVEHITGEKPEL